MPGDENNGYVKDLIIDVLFPASLDDLGASTPITETEHLLRERATRLYEENKRALQSGNSNLYIPDGEVLVRVAEPARQDDTDPRRIVYVPEPYYAAYQLLQEQSGMAEAA